MIFSCPDCESYPPHIIETELKPDHRAFECRDCGCYWEEYDNPPEFFENLVDEDG
jgi:transcription initiation factor TFIIIB Brf1 subunit/transcription initiation factor TFIIB